MRVFTTIPSRDLCKGSFKGFVRVPTTIPSRDL